MTNRHVFTYKPSWVANSFLQAGRSEGITIDPLKIQKLVYCLHGWYLATTATPAVGERFEAWPKGPVNSSLYQAFKKFRWRPITEYAKDVDPATGESSSLVVAASDELFHDVFARVWDRYKGMTGPQLSALTHAPGTPWSKARESGYQYINDDEIKAHFLALGRRAA